jgi:hypothetical protein
VTYFLYVIQFTTIVRRSRSRRLHDYCSYLDSNIWLEGIFIFFIGGDDTETNASIYRMMHMFFVSGVYRNIKQYRARIVKACINLSYIFVVSLPLITLSTRGGGGVFLHDQNLSRGHILFYYFK